MCFSKLDFMRMPLSILQSSLAACLITSCLLAQTEMPASFVVDPGTRIPLRLINSVSTRNAAEGDRVYLETAFPILVGSRIVIPVGSHVAGTVTQVKKPGRVKGRGELYVRFDNLILPSGVGRDFRSRLGAIDGTSHDELDRDEGKITGEGHKAGDAAIVGGVAAIGASTGALVAARAASSGLKGVGIGAAIGAAAAMVGILVTRGPDAMLTRGATVEMILDRPLQFSFEELNHGSVPYSRPQIQPAEDSPSKKGVSLPGRNPLGRVL